MGTIYNATDYELNTVCNEDIDIEDIKLIVRDRINTLLSDPNLRFADISIKTLTGDMETGQVNLAQISVEPDNSKIFIVDIHAKANASCSAELYGHLVNCTGISYMDDKEDESLNLFLGLGMEDYETDIRIVKPQSE